MNPFRPSSRSPPSPPSRHAVPGPCRPSADALRWASRACFGATRRAFVSAASLRTGRDLCDPARWPSWTGAALSSDFQVLQRAGQSRCLVRFQSRVLLRVTPPLRLDLSFVKPDTSSIPVFCITGFYSADRLPGQSLSSGPADRVAGDPGGPVLRVLSSCHSRALVLVVRLLRRSRS